jgi:putative oxidoreductase
MLAKLLGESWDGALLLGRLALGVIFVAHGYQKLFVAGVDKIGMMFEQFGFPAPLFFAWVVSLVEFFGGIAVLVGVLTRWAALGLAITMVVAILTVKLPKGLIAQQGVGYELDLALLGLALVLLLAGPGRISLEKGLLGKEL